MILYVKKIITQAKEKWAVYWPQEKPWYRLQQFIILLAHFALLKWIIFTLHQSGAMSTLQVFGHFTGMSLFGAFLIWGTAKWAKFHHEKNLAEKGPTSP